MDKRRERLFASFILTASDLFLNPVSLEFDDVYEMKSMDKADTKDQCMYSANSDDEKDTLLLLRSSGVSP